MSCIWPDMETEIPDFEYMVTGYMLPPNGMSVFTVFCYEIAANRSFVIVEDKRVCIVDPYIRRV